RSQAGAVNTIRRNGSAGFFKTGRAGTPDITVCYQGKFVGIEVKNKKGKQSESQKQAQETIEKTGGYYFIVRSLDELISIFKQL
ncbi:MAG: VRR-NUC domain-containing protein, partial [Flammeovirgaceae bacterium]